VWDPNTSTPPHDSPNTSFTCRMSSPDLLSVHSENAQTVLPCPTLSFSPIIPSFGRCTHTRVTTFPNSRSQFGPPFVRWAACSTAYTNSCSRPPVQPPFVRLMPTPFRPARTFNLCSAPHGCPTQVARHLALHEFPTRVTRHVALYRRPARVTRRACFPG